MINRTFTLIDYPEVGDNYGRYISPTPGRAAHKAFSKLCRKIDLKNTNSKNFLVFTIQEIGNKNKQYKYAGTRVKLARPLNINIGGKNVNFNYKNIIAPYHKIIL